MLPDGTTVTNFYYDCGDLRLTYGSRVYPVEYEYDSQGRMTKMINWTHFATSSGARATRWEYDSQRGWLTKKIDAATNEVQYTYTKAGRLRTRTWARGVTATYTNNLAGDLMRIEYSDGTPGVTNTYDRAGRIQQVDFIGSSTYEYNGQSKLFRQKFGSITLTNAFDTSGRRRALGWANATTSQATHSAYDNANRLVGLTNGNFNLRYDYEPNSHLVKALTFRNTNATRMTTSKSYDKVNRLLKISSSASGLLLPESYAYDYNNASQRTRLTLADGSAWNYGYDSLGQVTSGKKNWSDGTAVPGQQFEYGYDDIGNRIFAREGGDNNGNGLRRSGYSVDSVNQYTSRTNAGGFDMIGIANALASVTVNNQTTYRKGEYFHKELSVNNAGGAQYQQLTNIASIPSGGGTLVSFDGGQVYVPPATETFTHDLDGNLTQNGRWNLVWDAENRLINVAARNASETATNIAFQYDNLWRRTYKKVSLNNGTYTTNRFAYDGWNLVAEFDGATNILKSYMWGKDLSGTEQGAGGVGGLISMTLHSGTYAGTYFYTYDGNGNVTALINGTTGAVYARYEYDPFHNLIRSTGPLAKLNNFLAATKYYDWETGLYYYGYRYCEPDTGRWLSNDPIREMAHKMFQPKAKSMDIFNPGNLSDFVNNNPISSIDPDGRNPIVGGGLVIGIGVALGYCGNNIACRLYRNNLFAQAEGEAHRHAPDDSRHSGAGATEGGDADALTHCIASCNMAKDPGPCGGLDRALNWLQRREVGNAIGTRLDRINNENGFAIGMDKPKSCTTACVEALRRGLLNEIVNGQIVASSVDENQIE